ncbi:flavodoxin family protein [Pseudomonas piscis]|uniref:flavodoxin family protein n=1 Tax=Pseudomonas piscis TaxID=2614538 RepID=UPI0039A5EA36
MSMGKWALVALVVVVLVPLLVLISVSWIEQRQARRNQAEVHGVCAPASRTAVIYYSRSGNTEVAARHIACRLGATLIALDAPDYALGLRGLGRALWDARGESARITPNNIDLQAFDTVYLGSPVWLYSPAPPIWAFVAGQRLDGKHVVLFNTYNSHFAPEYIAAFRDRVMAQGASSFEHRSVLRGRMTQQLTREQMLQRIDQDWLPANATPTH